MLRPVGNGLSRRWFLRSTALSAFARGPRRPNILFILADDLGPGHVGCYGQDRIRTPNIDRLAREGMRFTSAYSGCCVCAPSRSVLLTGYHAGHTSVRANFGGIPLLPEDITVGQTLKQAGYATGVFGKWGMGDEGTGGVPNKKGFDEFFGYLHHMHAHFQYPEFLFRNDVRYPLQGNADGRRGQYAQDAIVAEALDFIRRNKDKPFFCYVPMTLPHWELLVPEDSLADYRGKFPETPYTDSGKHFATQQHPRAAFAGMVSRLDRDVGRFLALLNELDLEKETVVFFTSDNGPQYSKEIDTADFFHGAGSLRGYKGDMYEGGIRVPSIARWPEKIAAGAVSDLPWAFCDVMPTLAELSGATAPPGIDGISIVPTLLADKRPQKRHDFLYWEMPRYNFRTQEFHAEIPAQAARMGHWKAVRPKPDGTLELYNLKKDNGEKQNLAERNPQVLARFQEYLKTARTAPRPQTQPPQHWWSLYN